MGRSSASRTRVRGGMLMRNCIVSVVVYCVSFCAAGCFSTSESGSGAGEETVWVRCKVWHQLGAPLQGTRMPLALEPKEWEPPFDL